MTDDMAWTVGEAIGLIDQLQKALQGQCSAADEVVGAAKLLWQDNQQEAALDRLINFVDIHGSKIAQQLPVLQKLRALQEQLGHGAEAQDKRIRKLEAQVHSQQQAIGHIQQDAASAKAASAKRFEQLLLGQAAYSLSGVIELYIYGPGGDPGALQMPPSLTHMNKCSQNGHFTDDQQSRWESVKQYCSRHMPFQQLLAADRALRDLRREPAHGSRSEIRQITLQDLENWAGKHCNPKAIRPIQQYARLLNQFSTSNRPLAPDLSGAIIECQS